MGVNFGNNVTQTLPAVTLQVVDQYYNSINNYSTNSGTYQRVFTWSMTPKVANSKLIVTLELCGHNSNGGHDNNFRIGWYVNGGSTSYIGANPSVPSGNGSTNLHGNVRGDHRVNSWTETWMNRLTGNWSAGDTVTFFVDTIGEGTWYANQGNSTGQTRFGRGTSKMVIEEIMP